MTKRGKGRQAVTKPLSLFPRHAAFIQRRTKATGLNASEYVRKLLEFDEKKNVIGDILREDAERAATATAA